MRWKHREPPVARAADRPEVKEELRTRRRLFLAYLADCMSREDWHGVMDAAADLREIDAALKVLS